MQQRHPQSKTQVAPELSDQTQEAVGQHLLGHDHLLGEEELDGAWLAVLAHQGRLDVKLGAGLVTKVQPWVAVFIVKLICSFALVFFANLSSWVGFPATISFKTGLSWSLLYIKI